MELNFILALCILILTVGLVLVTIRTVKHFQAEVRHYRFLYDSIKDDAGEWEKKALGYSLEATELANNFEERVEERVLSEKENWLNQMNVKLAPDSHDVAPIDAEQIVSESMDEFPWTLVVACRQNMLMASWLAKNPGVNASQPHVRYSEFATFVANLPPDKQTVEGVREAVEAL